jgi:hypothetical protein
VTFEVSTDGVLFSQYGAAKTLSSGSATSDSYTPSAAGTYYFRAVYAGDSNYLGSQSGDAAEPLTVNKASSTTSTVLSGGTITLGGSVTDTATVTAGATGQVTFYVKFGAGDWAQLGAVKDLVAGSATSDPYTPLAAGDYLFRALYGGDSNYLGSQSGENDEPLTATAVYKDYLGHAKEEIADLRAYVQNLYDQGKIGKNEYNHFLKDLDKVEKDIDKAITNLDTARVGYDDKMKGYDDLRKAVMKLKHVIKDVQDWAKKGKITTGDAAPITSELEAIRMKLVDKAWAEALAEKALALQAIAEAQAQGKDTAKAEEEIAKIDKELTKAIQEIAKGNLSQAIQHFKHAFAHSQHAVKKAYDKTWTIDYKDWIDDLEIMAP